MPTLIGRVGTVRWLPICLVLLAALLLLGQQTLKIPGDTRLSAALHNAMRVPWAMVLSFIVWKLSGSWLRTFLIIPVIGLISEGLQHLSGRSPSLFDIFSDLLGLGLAGCLYALFVQRSRSTIWLPVLGILYISLWTTRPIAMVFASESWLYARAPLLFDGKDPRGFYLAEFTAEMDYNMFSAESVRLTLMDDQWSGVHIKTFRMFGRCRNSSGSKSPSTVQSP